MSGNTRKTEKERRRKERADRFWGAFLFTENGKPKSSLLIYTFCLSFVFAAVYVLCYEGAMRLLTDPLSGWRPWMGNLVIALTASAAGAMLCCLPHRFFSDKRLVFGGHLWLALYAVAVMVTMLIFLSGTGATGTFMTFFGWFVVIPVALGTGASALLYRRDHHSAPPSEEEPEWKKYVNRR